MSGSASRYRSGRIRLFSSVNTSIGDAGTETVGPDARAQWSRPRKTARPMIKALITMPKTVAARSGLLVVRELKHAHGELLGRLRLGIGDNGLRRRQTVGPFPLRRRPGPT